MHIYIYGIQRAGIYLQGSSGEADTEKRRKDTGWGGGKR